MYTCMYKRSYILFIRNVHCLHFTRARVANEVVDSNDPGQRDMTLSIRRVVCLWLAFSPCGSRNKQIDILSKRVALALAHKDVI
jgi:hypothetical protein